MCDTVRGPIRRADRCARQAPRRSAGTTSVLRLLATSSVVLASWMPIGCGGGAKKVVPDKARATLRTTLDAWQQRRSPDDLRALQPEIVAQDFDWLEGRRLLSYEVLDETDDTLNLRFTVRLVLEDESGNPREKLVGYVVGTSPVLTVFREAL